MIILASLTASGETIQISIDQHSSVNHILKGEKNEKYYGDIVTLINYIDSTYTTLHENINAGRKIVIFFDPAHGIMHDGRWQGGRATNRQSCTDMPEEYYSIMLSRKFYSMLKANKHIDVKTTDEFQRVLDNESDEYRDITFRKTVELAYASGAFMIVSQHLNNVSSIHKASGLANIKGIHVTYNFNRQSILRDIQNVYSGFLTLYNKYDASGFSRLYAENLRDSLQKKGMKANNWQHGAVGDNRFTYFIDFPVSVIYESGFISNVDEERNLRDPEFQDKIILGQYNSLMESIKSGFGIDISSEEPAVIKQIDQLKIINMKLSRIAAYYIRKSETAKAISTIIELEKVNKKKGPEVAYYSKLKGQLKAFDQHISRGNRLLKTKKRKAAAQQFALAKRSLGWNPVFSSYYKSFSREIDPPKSTAAAVNKPAVTKREVSPELPIRHAGRQTPVILTVDKGQTLEEAVYKALRPDDETLKILVKNLTNPVVSSTKNVKVYSKKHKKHIYKTSSNKVKVKISEGIYIIKLDRELKPVSINKVSSVHLDPEKFQNQMYLKNSYFAEPEKEKDI